MAESSTDGSRYGEALTTSAIMAEAVTGSHVLQIKEYSLTKGLGNAKHLKSSTFSVGGHRWYIRYYADGDSVANANWISIYLQHDDTDDVVDVKARYKFSVVDDICGSVLTFKEESTTLNIFSSKNRCWGFPKFVERKALEESSYLKDDSFKVKCDVTVSKDIIAEATIQYVVVPPSNMHQNFGWLLSDAVGADMAFEVAGEMFAAHRCVLAARSSVFKAELFGSMKEKTMDCIRIQDMEARVFKTMLHFIYTDTVPDIDNDDAFVIAQHLLVAADRYGLDRLKLICEKKLCQCVDTISVTTTLALAEQHACHGLKKACLEFLKSPRNLKTVMATDGFDHLFTTCPSLVKELLAKVANCP